MNTVSGGPSRMYANLALFGPTAADQGLTGPPGDRFFRITESAAGGRVGFIMSPTSLNDDIAIVWPPYSISGAFGSVKHSKA